MTSFRDNLTEMLDFFAQYGHCAKWSTNKKGIGPWQKPTGTTAIRKGQDRA